MNEDLKQENSELQEKLRVLVTDKEVLQLRMDELQKKLEMSELLLQQVRGWAQGARPPSWGQCLQSLWVTPSQGLENLDPYFGLAIESSRTMGSESESQG